MAGISVTGLISNSFDWKSVVDQLIQIDSAPIARLQSEEAGNNDQLASLASLRSRMTDLQSAAASLFSPDLFSKRSAASATTGSTWTVSADSNSVDGNYTIAVSKLATASRLEGASGISNPISLSGDVSQVTVSTLPIAKAITTGTFTVNGKSVTITDADLAGNFQDLLDKISDATGSVVQASYEAGTDTVKLTTNGGPKVVLGAANDTSNFLSALRLSNNGTDTAQSSGKLGAPALGAFLNNARLSGSMGTVDPDGHGQFEVNGVPIDYNVNTDSLSAVLARITTSSAGVSASYDSVLDRVILTNKTTGSIGVGVTDKTGQLAGALGLTSGRVVTGDNAEFSVNNGGTQWSYSNTLDAAATGIAGLSVTVNTTTTQTINVSPDTKSMRTAVESFIAKFNDVQNFIESETKITKGADGKVVSSTLSNNREVQSWASELRKMAFGEVSGLTGAIQRLDNLGIDFNSEDSTLSIKDSAKLDAALTSKTADVKAFFTTGTTGFAARMKTYLTDRLDTQSGGLASQTTLLNKANTDIDTQIATLNRRLTAERERLTTAFLAMQQAQSQASQQQTALTNMMKKWSGDSSS